MSRRAISVVCLAVVAVLAVAGLANAAPRPTPSCSFTPSAIAAGEVTTLSAVDLPTDTRIGYSFRSYDPSVFWVVPEGAFSITGVWPLPHGETTAYIWTRGRGKSLIKAGPGLNDYHVIAMCQITVT